MFKVVPITLRMANAFVVEHHRHNGATRGCKFAIAAMADGAMVGVAIVGRPLARMLDDGLTAEVLRVCVLDGAPKNTCSFLYGRCWRIWQQMGGQRMLTYTLQSESGASLRGAGWGVEAKTKPSKGGWDRESRERNYQPIYAEPKLRWSAPS
jgi:hypothetical protein